MAPRRRSDGVRRFASGTWPGGSEARRAGGRQPRAANRASGWPFSDRTGPARRRSCGASAAGRLPIRARSRCSGGLLPGPAGGEELGFVPQEIALYPDLTARENLEAFGRFHGLRGRSCARPASGRWRGPVSPTVRRPDEDVLRRNEAPRQHRLRRAPPPAGAAPGRADGRGRPPEPGAHLRHARGAPRPGHLHPADDPSAGRGGAALRPHRDHRPRPGHRRGHARASSSRARSGSTGGWS